MVPSDNSELFPAQLPDYLHHYTSFEGMLGILNSKSIWASDTQSLNDKKEAAHARDVVIHSLKNIFYRGNLRDRQKFLSIQTKVAATTGRSSGFVVCSFSEGNDLLSQWRAYGADGGGVSIGLSAASLEKIRNDENYRIGKCLYDRKRQYAICEQFLETLLSDYDLEEIFNLFPDKLCKEINEFVYSIGLFLKHESFLDEREWRITSNHVHLYSDRWLYRATSNAIVRYVQIDISSILENSHIEGRRPPFMFTLGPTAKRPSTSTALQAITYKLLGKGFGTTISSSPYSGQ